MSFLIDTFKKAKANIAGVLLFLLMASISVGLFMHNKAAMDAKNSHITFLEGELYQKDQAILGLKDEAKKAEGSAKISEKTITDLKTEVDSAKREQLAATAEIKRQMEAINAKYDKLPKNAVNDERKSSEIAVVRASGLWASYCLQEPTHVYCKK